MLTILGLGPGDPQLLTRQAWEILNTSDVVYLRTRKHPTVAGLPAKLALRDFDELYERGSAFADVYAHITDAVIAQAQQGDMVYAVPGHPLVGEATVHAILHRAHELGIPTRIVGGLSFVEPVLEAIVEGSMGAARSTALGEQGSRLGVPSQGAEEQARSTEPGSSGATEQQEQDHGSPSPAHPLSHSPALPLSIDPVDGLQICDALELAALHHPSLNPDKPALIAQVYSRAIASDLKLTLMNQYPPEHEVWVVNGSLHGVPGLGATEMRSKGAGPEYRAEEQKEPKSRNQVSARNLVSKDGAEVQQENTLSPTHPLSSAPVLRLPLHQLDHHDIFDHLTTLYVPALPFTGGFEAFQETIAFLRAPNGCPWDREQTHESLRTALLEEVYEVLDALDQGDLNALQEELGDVLMNVVMQIQIATEAEEFRMVDVIGEIDAKLKRRHPHVFGDVVVNSVGDVLTNWNAIKQQEHKTGGKPARESAIDGVPPALPALAQAQKLAHKAERAGFKFDNHEQRLAKSHEELDEVLAARDDGERAEEMGDLLFTIADLADGYGIDVETALREANLKFSRRFRAMEAIIRARNLQMDKLNADELQAVWREVKQAE
jgi:tetrapyrrole methylase family protein/MazG family protein